MKLAPIWNPHSESSKIDKKTKTEERNERLQETRLNTIMKYSIKKEKIAVKDDHGTNIEFKCKESLTE